MAVARTLVAGLEASLAAITAYVKPCTLHALSPHGLEAYASSVLRLAYYSHQLAELGADVAEGRYQPGSGRLGSLVASVIKDVCARHEPCPHDMIAGLAVAAVAYSAATRRGGRGRDALAPAIMSVLAHTGRRDVEDVVAALEAVAPRERAAIEDALVRLPPSPGLQEMAEALAGIRPGYRCIAEPATCLRVAAGLRDPYDRFELVSAWLREILPRCAPELAEALPREARGPELQRRLLGADVECRKRGLHERCYRMVAVLAVAAFVAAVTG